MERDGKTYCDRHPNVESSLRCSRCERYICPECAVLTSVGYRCQDCGRERSAIASVPTSRLAVGVLSGLLLGGASGFLVPRFGFFVIFIGAILGGIVGEAISRLIGRKRSPFVAAAASLGFVGGAMLDPLTAALSQAAEGAPAAVTMKTAISDVWGLVFAIVASVVAWSRLG